MNNAGAPFVHIRYHEPLETRKNHHELLLQEDASVFLFQCKRLFTPSTFTSAARLFATREGRLYRLYSGFFRTDIPSSQYNGEELYHALNERLQTLEAQGVSEGTYRVERKKLKAEADAELELLWQRVYRVREKSHQESTKHERYCREQRDLLRALEDLAASERVMHELDNRKDQIMTVCKVALANLTMWIRDRFFPSPSTHATWQRLQPFFRLPGRVRWEREEVHIELRSFNNRQLTRDLVAVCQRVNEIQLRLPDGRLLILHAPSLPFG